MDNNAYKNSKNIYIPKFKDNEKFMEIVKFHGHVCPGIAIGYRAAEIAMDKLSSNKSEDEEFIAIVENDSCSVDAIQVLAGCTFGKGNLFFKDYGKQVYTFLNRNTDSAIRLALKKEVNVINPEFLEMREKLSNSSNESDKLKLEEIKNKTVDMFLDIPADELFKIEEVEIDSPLKAKIFKSIKCSNCGEAVSQHRTRVVDDNLVCIPCFESYLNE